MAYTTINKSTDYFNTKLYTGNGGSNRGITGVGFQPDWLWLKTRSKTNSHILIDAVRGANRLRSNSTAAQASVSGEFISFDTDGFTVTENASNEMNNNSTTYASWNWKAGGGQGSSNTDGSINTTYTSVNTTAGFSISQYEGTGSNATFGHGLGVAPKMVIVKNIDATQNWFVYHQSIGATKVIYLDLANAEQTLSQGWNNTAPTSSVVSIGTEAGVNQNGSTHIAYCFAEKTGYSKIGSYQGSSGNSFIYTGFKPAFLLVKSNTYSSGKWRIYDNKRSTSGFNVIDDSLRPNTNGVEDDEVSLDFLSNGFKWRANYVDGDSGGTGYIYMAFAEAPLVGTNNIPATAR